MGCEGRRLFYWPRDDILWPGDSFRLEDRHLLTNAYSPTWYELFLGSIQPLQTEAEVAFLARHLPLPEYRDVLDLCCGWGRHARLLAERGYRVTGVDRDPTAIDEARRRAAQRAITYVVYDMRRLAEQTWSFAAVINLWQSFGYFDEASNAHVLCQINQVLRPHGRLILDLYHRGFFERHQETRTFERGDLIVTERKSTRGNRLTVRLEYGSGRGVDAFEWQLYAPEELRALAEQNGFRHLLTCARFDECSAASPDEPRMQLVLEKRSP